jgi:hypothetical protein
MKAPAREGLSILAACALFGGPVAANASPYVVTLEETDQGVVATGSGAIDLTGLELYGAGPPNGVGQINPTFAVIGTGPVDVFDPNTRIDVYLQEENNEFMGPMSFGSGLLRAADDGSGPLVLLCGACQDLDVPEGYVSDTPLSDASTYEDQSFGSLGVTPGTYKWTWGIGADQSFTLQIGLAEAIPEPATLPLFAGGLGFVVYLSRRRKEAAPIAA